MHGDPFLRAIVPFSAQPFNFARAYQIKEEEVILQAYINNHTIHLNYMAPSWIAVFYQIRFIVSQADVFPKMYPISVNTGVYLNKVRVSLWLKLF